MPQTTESPHAISVSDAASKGISALVKEAESGRPVVVERRHQPIAAIVGIERLEALEESERDLRDIGLILARAASDTGHRTNLSDVISHFGFDCAVLEAELLEDLAAGRE